jgi:methylase of polypeptide subunit release factors
MPTGERRSDEEELHPSNLRAFDEGYDRVVDVGCAEGYSAVGFARRLPSVEVLADDIDPKAVDLDRVIVGRTL